MNNNTGVQIDGMKIRLGLHLDGQHGTIFKAELDGLTTGPLGMPDVLETQMVFGNGTLKNIERLNSK